MRIYIIRHGETLGNRDGRLQGWTDNPLNEFGIKLAELTAEGMLEEGISFDAAFTSPLSRARLTAEIILEDMGLKDLELQVDERIKEMHMGDWEGRRYRPGECEVDFEQIREFFSDPIKGKGFPGGENIPMVMRRTQEFLRELAQKDYESVLVSCHGCAVRAMLNFLYEDKSDFWQGTVPVNCSVNIIDAENGEFKYVAKDKIFYSKEYYVNRFVDFKKAEKAMDEEDQAGQEGRPGV